MGFAGNGEGRGNLFWSLVLGCGRSKLVLPYSSIPWSWMLLGAVPLRWWLVPGHLGIEASQQFSLRFLLPFPWFPVFSLAVFPAAFGKAFARVVLRIPGRSTQTNAQCP